MVNKVILIGNLGKDPEIKHLENGAILARFSLATNENYLDKNGEWQQITDWHNIVMWGKNAERAEKYLHKGNTVFIEGKLRTRKWQDSNGNDRYTTEINALSYKVIDRKDSSESSQYQGGSDSGTEKNKNDIDTSNTENSNNAVDNQVDDLPF